MGDMNLSLPPGIKITDETPDDIDGIRRVNRTAFGGEYEAQVVDRLRENCPDILSLVAKQGDEVVGHIMFSPAQIHQEESRTINGMGLAPLAVLPGYQGRGIGTFLCQEGMQRMKSAGYPFVIVLGHPRYYPRFGFVKASQHDIVCAFENVPDDAFMICIFKLDEMKGVRGVAHYRREFDETI